MWTCPKCRSKVDNSFEICWKCGTTPDGIEDPTFVTVDDEEPSEEVSAESDDSAGEPLADGVDLYMTHDARDWLCPKCRSRVEDSFEVCWSCGTTRDGVEDPAFVKADDQGAIEDPLERDQPAILNDLDDFAGAPLPELVNCFVARNTIEAKFVADRLVEEGIAALADNHDINIMMGGFKPGLWGYGPKVRVQRKDLARALAWIRAYEEHRKSRPTDSE